MTENFENNKTHENVPVAHVVFHNEYTYDFYMECLLCRGKTRMKGNETTDLVYICDDCRKAFLMWKKIYETNNEVIFNGDRE